MLVCEVLPFAVFEFEFVLLPLFELDCERVHIIVFQQISLKMQGSLDFPVIPAADDLHPVLDQISLDGDLHIIIILFTDMVFIQVSSLRNHLLHIVIGSKLILDHWLHLIMEPFPIHNKLVLVASRVETDLADKVPLHFNHGFLVTPLIPLSQNINLLGLIRPK